VFDAPFFYPHQKVPPMRTYFTFAFLLLILGLHSLQAQNQQTVPNLVRRLKDKDEDVRLKAARALGNLGKSAASAAAALKEIAENDPDDTVRLVAKQALDKIAKTGRVAKQPNAKVADLLKKLRSTKPAIRNKAIEELKEMGEEAKDISRDLVAAMAGEGATINPQVAAEILEKINPDLYTAVTTILVDEDFSKKMQAVQTISTMGEDGAAAVPALLAFCRSGRSTFANVAYEGKAGALRAMVRVAHRDPKVISTVLEAISTDVAADAIKDFLGRPQLRLLAIELLPELELSPKVTVPKLMSALHDRHGRIAAINALAEIGPDAKAAVTALRQLKFDSVQAVREAAANALEKIDPK
jgi:HEAT repeat protein